MKYRVGLTDGPKRKTSRRRRRVRPRKVSRGGLLNFGKYKRRVSSRAGRKAGRTNALIGALGKNPLLKKKLIKGLYVLLGVGFFLGAVGIVGAGIYLKGLESSLPNPDKLVERDTALSTQIFDRNGELLYTVHGDQNREFVKLDDIPEHTKWALLAAEDVDFYQHKGLDLFGIAKAGYDSVVLQIPARGASTVSQQLVRNTILFDVLGDEAYERTISRKVKEILITMQIEQNFSKDDILQLYMNEVPLGGVNYGFQAAAEAYFGKDVSELSIAESALLSGLIQSPGVYSPLFGTRPELAKERQTYVLNQMLKHKDLTGVTEEEIEDAKNEELVYRSKDVDINAPHFVFYVKQLLVEEFGNDRVERGGLKVTTSVDMSVQKIAQEEIENGIKTHGARWGVSNGAMVVIDPNTGDILAMVGSIDYNNTEDPKIDGNVNVTISPRQMGSSVKPYTYLTAFHQGYGPWLEAPDVDTLNFGAYKLKNWDGKYYGPMVARQALIQSRNIPAVYTMQLVGVDNFIETAETLGITTLTERDRYGLSLTLGAGEMKLLEHLGAFTVFANEGVYREPKAILEVKDSKGEELIKKEENKGKKIWDEREIYMLNWILCDLGGFGDQPLNHNYTYNGKRAYCGKTGTTDGPKDLTSMLYHKNLAVGVWAGNNNNIETPGAWSTTVPLPIASSFMTRMAGRYKPESFTRPSGIIATSVCEDTGAIAGKDSTCKKVASIYKSGSAPKVDKRESILVCKESGLVPSNLATAKEHGLTEKRTLLTLDLQNSLQESNYEKFLKSKSGYKYFFEEPKKGECELPLGDNDAPAVEITDPDKGDSFEVGSTITIKALANAKKSISRVRFYIDGVLIDTDTSAPYSTDYTIPLGTSAGDHSLKAIVTDSNGSTATDFVSIKVTSSISTSVSAPASGATISLIEFPYSISASTTGDDIDSVKFEVNGSVIGTDSSSASWTTQWTYPGAGSYTIRAIAVKDGAEYPSSPISVTVL